MDPTLGDDAQPGLPPDLGTARVVIPPLGQLSAQGVFQPPLTEAERALVDTIHSALPAEWTLFVRPQIGIGTPTAAMLSPQRGLLLLQLVSDDFDEREAIGRLRRMRDELAFVLVPQLGEWLDGGGPDDSVRAVTLSEQAVLDGKLDPAFFTHAASAPETFEPSLEKALARVLGDRWVEGHAPTPLQPNAEQRGLLTPAPGYHLIRGMAGSGKSLILAYRAATAARSGRRVLIATYNRTLVNYIDHLLDTVPITYRRRLVTVSHFHGICDEIASKAGIYLPRPGHGGTTADTRAVFDEEWPALTIEALESGLVGDIGFDACFIDDGEDFPNTWFAVIERLARQPKEIVVAVDDAQDLYGRAPSYYPKLRAPRGRWTTYPLMKSPRLIPETKQAADELRVQMQLEMQEDGFAAEEARSRREGDCRLWQVPSRVEAGAIAIQLVMKAIRQDRMSPSDVAVLVPTHQVGAAVTCLLGELGVDANHIFPQVPRASEGGYDLAFAGQIDSVVVSRKRAFVWDDPRVKVVTLHSFKGWEAQRIVCILPGLPEPLETVSAYVGVTRSSQDLYVITTNDLVGLRTIIATADEATIDQGIASRFRQLYEAAEGLATPFRMNPVTADPGIEWGGYDVPSGSTSC